MSQPYSYFLKILEDTDYQNINNLIDHNIFLLLSLLILQPPLRTSFYSRAILTNSNLTKPDDKNNYLYLTVSNKAGYIVNNDNVSNSRAFKNKNKIEIANPKLILILNWSFKRFERVFLFENTQGEKVSEHTLRTYLRNITKINNINLDLMRSIYITEAYNTTAKTVKDREELAVQMRHSSDIASRAYIKINTDETPDFFPM